MAKKKVVKAKTAAKKTTAKKTTTKKKTAKKKTAKKKPIQDSVLDALKLAYKEFELELPADIKNSNATRRIRLLLDLACAKDATEISLSPFMMQDGDEPVVVLRMRTNSELITVCNFTRAQVIDYIKEWKEFAACDALDTRHPQDGIVRLGADQLTNTSSDTALDFQITFLPSVSGESMTVRIVAQTEDNGLKHIDYGTFDRERLYEALHSGSGLVLFAGGHNAKTLLSAYSVMRELASSTSKLISIEDPVLELLPWTTQVQVDALHDNKLSTALTAALLTKPDVLMFAETKEGGVLEKVLAATMSGMLAITTIMADDAADALMRLKNLGVSPRLLGESVRIIVAQRLVKKLCPHCSVEEEPGPNSMSLATSEARRGGLDLSTVARRFRKPVGCELCSNTGFRGYTVMSETLKVSTEIIRALTRGAEMSQIRAIAVSQGMQTLVADGLRRACNGRTALDQVMEVISSRSED